MDGATGGTAFVETGGKTVLVEGSATICGTQAKWNQSMNCGAAGGITVPHDACENFGTSNFTIEGWFYPTAVGQAGNSVLIAQSLGASNCWEWMVCQTTGSWGAYFCASSTTSPWDMLIYAPMGEMNANDWNHIVVCRDAGIIRYFVNGTMGTASNVGTAASIYAFEDTRLEVGHVGLEGAYFQGFIDEVRTEKGYAKYTEAFTPPNAPFGTSGTYYAGNVVVNDGNAFICHSSHEISAITEPGVGTSWQSYWNRMSTSGSSGTSGTAGTSGTTGTSGTSGTSGSKGSHGTSGTSGTSGTGVTSGTSGTAGTSGTSGVDGTFYGSSGTSGTSPVSTCKQTSAGTAYGTALVNIAGMAFSLTANHRYTFEWQLSYKPNAVTSGFGLAVSGGPLNFINWTTMLQTGLNATNSTSFSQWSGTHGTAGTAGSHMVIARNQTAQLVYQAMVWGVIEPTSNCTLQLQFKAGILSTSGTVSLVTVPNQGVGKIIDMG